MRELEEYRAELAQEEAEARRLDSFRTSLEEVQAHLDWAVGNMAAIQTRFVAARQRLERCAPEDRDEYRAELEDTRQRLRWAEASLTEAQERVAICAEELAEANVVGTRDLVREAQDNIGFWADELSEALAKAQARTRTRG